jgi:hypothetical protein
MNHPDNEINGVFLRRSGVGGETARRRRQFCRIGLRTRVGAELIDTWTEFYHLLLIRLIVVEQRVLGTDMDFDAVFDSHSFHGLEAFGHFLVPPFVSGSNGKAKDVDDPLGIK